MRYLITIAWEWGIRCFGVAHMQNKPIRALRAAEEVIELAQALRVPKSTMLLLVETVYKRPAGEPYQEIGGSLVTLFCLCRSMGIEPEEAFSVEVRRCLSKDPAHFRDRNQNKIDMGLDA